MFAPKRRRLDPRPFSCFCLPSCYRRCLAAALLVICATPAAAPAAAENTPSELGHFEHPAHRQHPHHLRHGTHLKPTHRHLRRPAAPPAAPAIPRPLPVPVPVPAPPPPPPANLGATSGLPLPRFAALRSDEVNLRVGPGSQYPIKWLYKRRDLPVEIDREFKDWREVKDPDGEVGWVHKLMLTGTRSFVVTATAAVMVDGVDHGPGTALREDDRDDAGIVAILRPGVIGHLRECPAGSGWCRVTTRVYSGWLRRSAIFGLLPNEPITNP